MKHTILLFTALTLLASCGGDISEDTTDAKVDSQVNAKLDVIMAQMKANNDSLINVMAKERADSILKTMNK